MTTSPAKPVGVLFLNTRSALGADVAVHLTLLNHLPTDRCSLCFATNRRSRDLSATLEAVRGVPELDVCVLNLGFELAGRSRAGKLLGAVGNLLDLAGALTRLAWLVRRRHIDIIHTTDRPRDVLFGTLLARLTGRKNIVHIHVKWEPPSGRLSSWAMAHADAALAISCFVQRSLVRGGWPAHRIFTALNAIEPDRFNPANVRSGALRARLGLTQDTPIIGIVARIMQWKGHRELVRALAALKERHPDAHVAAVGVEDLLAGTASYRAEVEQEAEALGVADRWHWLGWQEEMAPLYADMDVVCVPSWEEPFGLVVAEAMAMERPVAGFDSGALPELVRNEVDGLLVPPLEVPALADALHRLLADPGLRRTLGANGRARVLERFSAPRQADEVAVIYTALRDGVGDGANLNAN